MQSNSYVGFTANSGRGTLELIWCCLITVLLCTWNIQRPQFVTWISHRTNVLGKRSFWFAITLLCPAYVICVAFEQWWRARKYREMRKIGYNDWTMQHGFYIDMGCFQVELHGKGADLPTTSENGDIIELDDGLRFTIRLENLILLMKADLLSAPDISTHDLEERNKNDRFARCITYLQVLYFCFQFFTRLGFNLPISTLELSTMAFIYPAALVEYLWWDKPLDLRIATIAKLDPKKNGAFIYAVSRLQFQNLEQDLAEWGKGDFVLFFNRLRGSYTGAQLAFGILIVVLVDSINFAAWNNSFPSETEQLLWRTMSASTCGTMILLWIGLSIPVKSIRLVVCSLSTISYCICRIYLMIGVFVSLRSVPEALYQTVPWLSVLPGI
ncbi:hypothetical protein ACMFMG_005964 [Clarireedia jacksonii]